MICTKCLNDKPESEFYPYSKRCKECLKKYATQYKKEHPESGTLYRFKNRERSREYSRQYYLKKGKEIRAKKTLDRGIKKEDN